MSKNLFTFKVNALDARHQVNHNSPHITYTLCVSLKRIKLDIKPGSIIKKLKAPRRKGTGLGIIKIMNLGAGGKA